MLTCQDTHHAIWHALSRIQTRGFQDVVGCSINGYRRFLFESKIVRDEDEFFVMFYKYFIYDHRGCIMYMHIEKLFEEELPIEILKIRNLCFRLEYRPIVSLPIDGNEVEIILQTCGYCTDAKILMDWKEGEEESRDVSKWDGVNCSNGHVLCFRPQNLPFHITDEFLHLLSLLPYLRYIFLNVDDLTLNQEEKLENLSLLRNLSSLRLDFNGSFTHLDFLEDLSIISNLRLLRIDSRRPSGFSFIQFRLENSG